MPSTEKQLDSIVLSANQLEALGSRTRSDIVSSLLQRGTTSVPEMSEELEATPKALYHHFHVLEQVGLLEIVDYRPTVRRPEAVYRIVAKSLHIPEKKTPELRKNEGRVARNVARAVSEQYARASMILEEDAVERKGMQMIYAQMRLDPEIAADFRQKMMELIQWAKAQPYKAGATRYRVCTLAAPELAKDPLKTSHGFKT